MKTNKFHYTIALLFFCSLSALSSIANEPSQPDQLKYLSQCAASVKRAWFPPAGSESEKGILTFILMGDGNVKDLKVAKSMHNKNADRSMLLSVKNSMPFPKPPQSCAKRLRLIFDVPNNPPGQPCTLKPDDK